MEAHTFLVAAVVLAVFVEAWNSAELGSLRDVARRAGVHYHSKRHMMPLDSEIKRRSIPATRDREPRERKKPTGHLAPLQDDDMDNDEVVSVAIGPPPMRPKYDKMNWSKYKTTTQTPVRNFTVDSSVASFMKDVLTQLGREMLTREVGEDFVFGQYVGTSMKNLSSDLKLRLQHEILEAVVRYQKINRGESVQATTPTKNDGSTVYTFNFTKDGKNQTEEPWPDFSNLANIVG